MRVYEQERRGREYLDFYERSEIKSLVTRDYKTHHKCYLRTKVEAAAMPKASGKTMSIHCFTGREYLLELERSE